MSIDCNGTCVWEGLIVRLSLSNKYFIEIDLLILFCPISGHSLLDNEYHRDYNRKLFLVE